MPKMVRLIKKYPNRRLYDTTTSTYITLSDVKALVLSAEAFTVLDARSGDDLTRSILLQIILEEESTVAEPLLGASLLSQLIRCYGHSTQGALGSYLETNVSLFSEFQRNVREHLSDAEATAPAQADLCSQFMKAHAEEMQAMLANVVNQDGKPLCSPPSVSIDATNTTSRADT